MVDGYGTEAFGGVELSIVKHFQEEGSVVLSEKQYSLKDWLEDEELPLFEEAHSGCVCDCEKIMVKVVLLRSKRNPKAYLSGGCK